MFIYNFKLNVKFVVIACICIAIISAIFIQVSANNQEIQTIKNENFDYILTDDNFSTVLKSIHDNIDKNINKNIKITGFVFRMPDFKNDFFVCGRNMSYNKEDKVIGALCQFNDSTKFDDETWVELTGTIIKGYYQGDMPIIKVNTIQSIATPKNTFVFPPNQ